jgi:DNA repair protein RadC
MNEERNITLKDWAEEDKPREKLLSKGKKELSNAELLAILIRNGIHGHSAIDLAKDILQDADNRLSKLSRMNVTDIMTANKGIGEAKAITIVAALELGYRMIGAKQDDNKETIIKDSGDLFHYISPLVIDLWEEEFWAIYLNIKNKVIYRQRICRGGLTETLVDIRVLFRTALEKNAVSMALCHNHPSGNLTPSQKDKELTKTIINAGKLLRINVIDHIIVGLNSADQPDYYSMFEQGLLG